MRKLFLSAAIASGVLAPHPAQAWGFEAHRYITERAIALLPGPIRPFFEKFSAFIVEHSIDPDLWRTAGWEAEPPRHFVDLDAYGPYPFRQIPRDYEGAVKQYGQAFVEKNGTLPWRTAEIHARLVEAFQQKAPYSRENIKFFAAVLSHYVADAHVPLHAALNYDGQLTGQWGIHARFESELFERNRDTIRLQPGELVAISSPRDFMFDTLVTSFSHVQSVLDADKAAVADREVYDDEYFRELWVRTQPLLERRLSESVTHVASMIADAWVDAGRPELPVETPRTPRKVRRK